MEAGKSDIKTESQKEIIKRLRVAIAAAAKKAPEVSIDPETEMDSDTLRMMDKTVELMRQGEEMNFEFEDEPHKVYADDKTLYPELIMLGLRQLLKSNFGLTNRQLDSPKYQEYYAEWYKINSEYQLAHESEHDKELKQHTTMETRLGIRFIKLNNKLKIVPDIDIRGKVTRTILIEKIVAGVEKRSKGDQYLINAYEEITGRRV